MTSATRKRSGSTSGLALLSAWSPALAVALLAALVIAYQLRTLSRLGRENAILRAAAANVEALQRENRGYQALVAENSDLNRLRRDAVELQTLRQEVVRLREQLREVATLEADNKRLRDNLATIRGRPTTLPSYNEQFFDTVEHSREKAQSISCINNLKQIGLAVRVYAADNQDRFPTSFNQLSNELSTPIVLLCPADTSKQTLRQSLQAERAALEAAKQYSSTYTLFSRLGPTFPTYQLFLTGDRDELYPQSILSKCPIHGHIGLADGSVQSDPLGTGNYREEIIDGRLTLVNLRQSQLEAVPPQAELGDELDPEVLRLLQERYGLDIDQDTSPDPR